MKRESIIALVLIGAFVALFTRLLASGYISSGEYVLLITVFALVSVAVAVLHRLSELDLRNFRVVLNQMKETKAEIEEMYGGIENLKKAPLVLDNDKMRELGLGIAPEGGPPRLEFANPSAVMRYPVGCMKRERERLASIFITEKTPQQVATAILDNSLDDNVFRWKGPEAPLHAPLENASRGRG